VVSGLLAGLVTSVAIGLVWVSSVETDPALVSMEGIQVLSDAQMKQIKGGWLRPKARKPRTGCCPPCQECVASSGGSSPVLDATTAEVSNQVRLMSVGAAETGLSLNLTYSSHLADGTNTILDTTLGSGWTHSYNSFLLKRGADFIWIRGDTEIVKFTNRGGVFTTSTGQFMEITVTDPDDAEVRLKDGTVYQFQQRDVPWEPSGIPYLLDAIVDPNQRTTAFTYAADGLLTTVTDPFQNSIDFVYGPDNKLSRVSASGREALLEYNAPTGQISVVVLPDTQPIEYEYNFRGQLTAEKVPGGGIYHVDYNAEGKAYRLRDPNGATIASQTSTTNWDPDHETSLATGEMHYFPGTVTVTDGRGNQWEHDYDARGNIVQTRDPAGNPKTIEYDSNALLPSRIVDANGNPTEYEYDELGNRTLVRDAEDNETHYEYEPVHNRMTLRTEPDGDEWIYRYDGSGNLIEEIDPLIEEPDDATILYEYYPNGLLWKKTDRNGNVTEWEYYPDGNISKVTDPAGCVTEYTYDAFGNVLTRTLHNDTGDQTTTYTYDGRDRVLTETDPLGNTTKYDYDPDGNRIAVYTCWVDGSNYRSVTRYEYDSRGRLITTIEDDAGLNRTTRYEYDGNDNRTREIDPNGIVTDYEYDPLNRLVRTVLDPDDDGYEGLEIEWQYEYDPVGNRISRTNPNGYATDYDYDVLNRLTFVTDPLTCVTEYRYFPPGEGGCCGTPGSSLIKCIIDAEGKVTQYAYDQLDRRTKEIRRVGEQICDVDVPEDDDDVVTEYEYDANGNLLILTDPNGNTTTYTYTVRDEVWTVANGCGETTTYEYDCAGNRIEDRPPNGNVISSEYDLNNRLVRICDTLGDVAEYTYDCVGNRLTEADPVGPPTVYEYDHLDRLVTVTDPMGELTHYEYDAVGNQTKIIDREDNETVYEYDAADRRTASKVWPDEGGDPAITTYEYDQAGSLIRITDGNGNATAYEYDPLNRLTTETYADETERRFMYDCVGNQLTREDNMGEDEQPGNITNYTYDDLHRVIRREYATGHADVFEYDKGGRMLVADNDHSHVGFTYDCADRVLTSTQTDLPQTYLYTVTYAYDTVANTRTIHYPSGKVVVETRDFRDRLAEVSDAATYAYDLADRVLTKTFANGTEARYSYNDNDWITELRHVAPDGTTAFAGFAHDYDREGNRLNAQNLQEVIPYDDAKPVTHSEVYDYDDIYRLIDYERGEWVGGDVPDPRRNRTWQLDFVHNWEQFTIEDLDDPNEDGTYCNSINQMNEYDDPSTDGPCPVPDDDGEPDDFMVPCPPAGPGGERELGLEGLGPDGPLAPDRVQPGSHMPDGPPAPQEGFNRAHDKNGNLVDDGEREFYYDYQTKMTSCLRAENRLTMVKDKATGDTLGEYWYDALGRRIHRLVPGSPDVSTVYVYTYNWRAIEEYENSVLVRNYAYGDWIDEVLTMETGGTGVPPVEEFYYHANALGSIIAVTDETGAPVERYSFDAYGAPSFFDAAGIGIPQSAVGNPFLFTGRRFDAESDLYYYRTRYLGTISGRFTTRDPIGVWGDLANLGNGYAYGADRVATLRDPLGLKCCCKKIIIKDKPRNSPFGNVKLGPTAQDNEFAYGFHVRVEATVIGTETIKDCDIKQWIFALQIVTRANGTRTNWLADATHKNQRVNDKTADRARADWTTNRETFHKDMDSSYFYPSHRYTRHGRDWLEWVDAPGWEGTTRLSARSKRYVSQKLTVKVICTGTDGKTITARFWKTQLAKSRNNKWEPLYTGATHPTLPHTWQ